MSQIQNPTQPFQPTLEFAFGGLGGTQARPCLQLQQPQQVLSAWQHDSQLQDGANKAIDLAEQLATMAQQARQSGQIMAGYLSYEALHHQYQLNANLRAVCNLPDVWVGLFEPNDSHIDVAGTEFKADVFHSLETKQHYQQSLKRINDYIHSGDCYQINYTQCFKSAFSGCSYSAYQSLLQQFQAPFAGFINTGYGDIMCFSPELFLHVDGHNIISTKPIKGTAARHRDQHRDHQAAQNLYKSTKNRAENLMIVDLLRNDLNKVCVAGSVTTDKLFDIEAYTNVHHMVSTISGELGPNTSPIDAFLSCFPGGSITGAPKRRAMHIIEELEQQKRHAYCGSMFVLYPNGEFHSNIMIRTVVREQNHAYCWAGGGIVADSEAESEYQECLDKVGKIMRHLEQQ